jgi:hypothetical protein
MVMLLRNAAGMSPASCPVSITVDTTPRVITSPANNFEVQVGTPVTIGGTANEPKSTIQLYYNGQVMTCTAPIVGSDGKWSFQVTLTTQGTHAITATATDKAGNGPSQASEAVNIVVTSPQTSGLLRVSEVTAQLRQYVIGR